MSADDTLTPWDQRPKYLKRFVDKRSGVERVYFRYKSRQLPMLSPWGTKALAAEAANALAAEQARPTARPRPGTINGAIAEYEKSADFASLAHRTQKEYSRVLRGMRATFEGVLLADISASYILELRDLWAQRGYRAANLSLQVLKNVCRRPMIAGDIPGDPFKMIDKVPRPHSLGEANPYWEDDEVDAAIELALKTKRPGLARAIALGRWGGFRKQTICSIPLRARAVRQTSNGAQVRLHWVTEKKKVLCNRREDPRLTNLIDATPSRALTVAYNSIGQPWTSRALSRAVERLLTKLSSSGKGRADLTVHGLRHARGVELARTGASDAEIMAQLDHATARAASIYRRQAEREQLADASQDRVDAEIIRLSSARATLTTTTKNE